MREVRDLCRARSLASARTLCGIAEDPNEDGRVRVVAAQQVLTWAYGKPPDYDPNEDRSPMAINLSVLSTEEKKQMLEFLRRGLVTEAVPTMPDTGEQIDGRMAASSRQCP
jgi:hypothetical protein